MQILALICLGTFPVAFSWADLLGRKPAHTFLDFSAAFVLAALPCAISLSNSGPQIPFMCASEFSHHRYKAEGCCLDVAHSCAQACICLVRINEGMMLFYFLKV